MNFRAAMNEITMKRDFSIEVNGVIQVLVNPPENFQPTKLNKTNRSMFNDCRAQSGGRQMGANGRFTRDKIGVSWSLLVH